MALGLIAAATTAASVAPVAASAAPSKVSILCGQYVRAEKRAAAAQSVVDGISERVWEQNPPPAILAYNHPENVAAQLRPMAGCDLQHMTAVDLRSRLDRLGPPSGWGNLMMCRAVLLAHRLDVAQAHDDDRERAMTAAGRDRAERIAGRLCSEACALEAELVATPAEDMPDVMLKVSVFMLDPGLHDSPITGAKYSLAESIVRDLAALHGGAGALRALT